MDAGAAGEADSVIATLRAQVRQLQSELAELRAPVGGGVLAIVQSPALPRKGAPDGAAELASPSKKPRHDLDDPDGEAQEEDEEAYLAGLDSSAQQLLEAQRLAEQVGALGSPG